MPLSRKHFELILATLKQKEAPRACAVCGHPTFILQDGLVFLMRQRDDSRQALSGPRIQCAAMSCENCGNTVLINLESIGLGNLLRAH